MTKKKPPEERDPAAVSLAKRRAERLGPERCAEIATLAGKANGKKWAEKRKAKIEAQRAS